MLSFREILAVVRPCRGELAGIMKKSNIQDVSWRAYRSGSRTPNRNKIAQMERHLHVIWRDYERENGNTLPWSREAECKAIEILSFIRSGKKGDIWRFVATYEFSVDHFITELRKSDVESESRWGFLLVVCYFFLAIELRRPQNKAEENLLLEKTSKYREVFQEFSNELEDLLSRREEQWARQLEEKLAQLAFTARWNATKPGDKRRDSEMRQFIIDSNIIAVLKKYNENAPYVLEGPLMEMNIASRMRKRQDYPEILCRLQKAEPRFDQREYALNYKEEGEPDLVDFKEWVKSPEASQYFVNNSLKLVSGTAIIILGLMFLNQADLRSAETFVRSADIRPNALEFRSAISSPPQEVTDIRPNAMEKAPTSSVA